MYHPQMPKQNGVAERLNQILVESAHSVLVDANEFCTEAVSTAVYSSSHCPTKAENGITPFEEWHCVKLKVKRHIRVDAHVHVPKSKRSKFDLNTSKVDSVRLRLTKG